SQASDQYSLACCYVELLTGKPPFQGRNSRQLMMKHLKAEPNLAALPEADRPAVARALAKDPQKRHSSCMEFIQALQECCHVPLALASSGKGQGVNGKGNAADDEIDAGGQLHPTLTSHASTVTAMPTLTEMRKAVVTRMLRIKKPADSDSLGDVDKPLLL